jgi:hypothetical protein
MYKGIKFVVIFISLTLLNGCASSCGSSVDSNSNEQSNKIIVPKRADNANIPTNTNGNANLVQLKGTENINAKNPTLDNSNVKVVNPSKSTKTIPSKKMPDNSVMSTESRGANFVETRKFNNHPVLDKLERVIKGAKDITVKIYLKNGKVYDLEDGKLKDYRTDSAETILEAIGVSPKAGDAPKGK